VERERENGAEGFYIWRHGDVNVIDSAAGPSAGGREGTWQNRTDTLEPARRRAPATLAAGKKSRGSSARRVLL